MVVQNHRVLSAVAAIAFLLSLSMCAPRDYEVVKEARESPIDARVPIIVKALKVGALLVDGRPEDEVTANFTGEERQAWVSLLSVARAALSRGLAENRGLLEFKDTGRGPAVELELRTIDLARQDPRRTPRTTLGVELRIYDTGGALVEQVRFRSTIEAEVVTDEQLADTRERRFTRASIDIGRRAAEYLRARGGQS